MKFFNTEGPMRPDDHYLVPPLSRIDLESVLELIERKKYFVLHAPRQTGKTSTLRAFRQHLQDEGRYASVYANIEAAQAVREDIDQGMWIIMNALAEAAQDQLDDARLAEWVTEIRRTEPAARSLGRLLKTWSKASDRPLVIFLDEVDALVGDTLISLLRQLRTGYAERPERFPQSIVLCGVRDVRDYRIHSAREKAVVTGGSAFNVKAKSLRMGSFAREELTALYQQHTEATGQVFEADALDFAWQVTQGQPWLVNALANEATSEIPAGKDRTCPVTTGLLEEAKERLILRRDTHLDQLVDKLAEPRVRRVVEPILCGAELEPALDDLQYVIDLGLVERIDGQLQIANPIYQEIIPRELTDIAQINLAAHFHTTPYVRPDRRLDIDKLLTDFQQFFRENAESWTRRFLYEEAGPQLLLQAFLQRVVNDGGRVQREYALGRRRTDLLVRWPLDEARGFYGAEQRVVIELKILHGSLAKILPGALEQTEAYRDKTGAEEAHLVVIDKTKTRSWDEKIFRRSETFHEREITVWGM